MCYSSRSYNYNINKVFKKKEEKEEEIVIITLSIPDHCCFYKTKKKSLCLNVTKGDHNKNTNHRFPQRTEAAVLLILI